MKALFLAILLFVSPLWAADVTLQWEPNTETDFAEYCIYRAERLETGSGPFGDAICGITEATYVDSIPKTVDDYIWLVTAKDIHGNESRVSNLAWSKLDKIPPAAVVELKITVEVITP